MIAPGDLTPASLGVAPRFGVAAPDRDVTEHVWRHGDDIIIGVQRDFVPNAVDETVVLSLPQAAQIYDLRRNQSLGRGDRVTLVLDPVTPALLSVRR